MWDGGKRFVDGLDCMVKHPIQNPQAYSNHFNPMRKCVAVLGNELSNKAEFTIAYCEANKLPYFHFRFDKTSSLTKSLDILGEKLAATDRSFLLQQTVLLLEGADMFAYDCDSESAVYQALHLGEWFFNNQGKVQCAKFIVVCLMDRVQTTQGNPAHLKVFYNQFNDSVLYFQPPHSTFIKQYIKEEMETFHAHYESQLKEYFGNRSYRLELTDENYTFLADASRYASVGRVRRFLLGVWRSICSPHSFFGEAINGTTVCAAPFVRSTPMGPHIFPGADALKKEESMMADTAGSADEIENSTKRMRL